MASTGLQTHKKAAGQLSMAKKDILVSSGKGQNNGRIADMADIYSPRSNSDSSASVCRISCADLPGLEPAAAYILAA